MKFDSPHWNRAAGSCLKHGCPELPCPACIADNDPDMEITFNDTEHDLVAYEIDGVKGYGDLVPPSLAALFRGVS